MSNALEVSTSNQIDPPYSNSSTSKFRPYLYNAPRITWLYLLSLAALVFVLNAPALGNSFVSDDWDILFDQKNHPGLFDGGMFWFGWSYVRPLGVLTWRVSYFLFGLNPMPYHLLTVALLVGNTWLVYSIVARLLGSRWLGAVAGLVFSTYHLGWEPALWLASSFFDVQSAFFMLLAFRLFIELQASLRNERRFWLLLLATLICYFSGVLTKEVAILLIPACLLYDFLYSRLFRRSWWQTGLLYTGMLGGVAFFLLTHYWLALRTTEGGTIRLVGWKQVSEQLFYYFNYLYLPPIFPTTYRKSILLKTEFKFLIWLVPSVLFFLIMLGGWWRNRQIEVKNGLKSEPERQRQGQLIRDWWNVAAVRLLVFGFGWTIVTVPATIFLNYFGWRFLYIPHIGVTFSLTAGLALVWQAIKGWSPPGLSRLAGYVGLAYLVVVLSLGGVFSYAQGRRVYADPSRFLQQLMTLTSQEISQGVTSITLINMPQVVSSQGVQYLTIFYGEQQPKEMLALKFGLDPNQIQVLNTADPAQLGYTTVGVKVAAASIPKATSTRAVIVANQVAPGTFQLVAQPLVK